MSVQRIRMTPVLAVGGLPLAGGLSAAVQLEPEGIALQQPATLEITPSSAPAADAATPFLFHAGGSDLHRFPEDPQDPGFVFELGHFSTAGVGAGTAADRANLDAHPPARLQSQLEARTSEIWDEKRDDPDADVSGRLGVRRLGRPARDPGADQRRARGSGHLRAQRLVQGGRPRWDHRDAGCR
jgi:hypothetical protein